MLIEKDEKEIRLAHRLQRYFLPGHPPDVDDFNFDVIYIPSHRLGGDSYNIYPMRDRYAIGYLADVSIRGIDASVFTLFLSGIIENFIQNHPAASEPSNLITYVHKNFPIKVFSEDIYLALMSFYVDTAEDKVVIANAGSQCFPIWSNGKIAEFIYAKGLPIGQNLPLGVRDDIEVVLLPGEKLLLYTNGVINMKWRDSKRFKYERLKAMFKSNFRSPSILHDIIRESLLFLEKRKFEDDIVMLLISNDKQPYHIEFTSTNSIEATLNYSLVRFISPFVKEILNHIHKIKPVVNDEVHRYILLESITNAVEHGNLGIDVERESSLHQELYRSRSRERNYYSKKVKVKIEIGREIRYEVMDEGNGFDWYKELKKIEEEGYAREKTQGRGFYILRNLSSSLTFNDKGNVIRLSVPV